ncbi:AraC family transcriptional regulator [Aetokthonos hydrillicola Thurmond2011]|uniref:AraC family transcriptional regulator n=1 Tax=Aetokthonos hydrillicola Thurmond2011 TaxID=2712845 RepID=A0AAP5M5Q2_9CYAN|nr:AraC family transcriptional regulator [Aetokthonos hydrillicola]MBO3462689.1 helix-turn-helix transcriptional regulator [Aetokthonos hydrillicola CCALA 1050]MBW4588060.1 AraC family transcriptional regulator [Aetokthonos hydrillicola CCALA 1050]MDR9893375.1 AraC family transcriptional regulator [Aetokthonos hydrillicola Thurmond2011]
MPEKKVLTIDFTQEDACSGIFERSPLISSHRTNWDGIRLDYYRHPPHETPEHTSPQHIIAICLHPGVIKAERMLDGRTQSEQMTYGDVIVIPATSYHKASWESEGEFLLLSLERDLFSRTLSESIDLQRFEIIPHFASQAPLIHHIGLALKSELESGIKGGHIYIESLATTLCIHLLRHYSTSFASISRHSQGLPQHKLRQATEYINENLEKDLTLNELSAVVGMSMYHFSRLFKQSTGFSPHQYVLNCRIEKAKRLLIRTEEAIDQICQQVGFQNQSHFTNVFRKLLGTTPNAYRKHAKI